MTAQEKFKVGTTVRIINDFDLGCGALKNNDITVVTDFGSFVFVKSPYSSGNHAVYVICLEVFAVCGVGMPGMSGQELEKLPDQPLPAAKLKCTCDFYEVILKEGCKCGGS